MKIIIFLLSILLLFSCNRTKSAPIAAKVVIIDKNYIPDSYHLNTGYGVTTSGKFVTTVQSSGEPEKFMTIVKVNDNIIIPIDDKKLYSLTKINDTIFIKYYNILKDSMIIDSRFIEYSFN